MTNLNKVEKKLKNLAFPKKKYTANILNKLPTLSQGQADDLKVELKNKRIWLSRMTVEDGMLYNNQITEEKYFKKSGMWKTVKQYRG